MLERELPDDVYVLGVDEHTGVVIDIDAQTATVVGKGVLTIRVKGVSTEIASGEVMPIDRLRNPVAGSKTGGPSTVSSNNEVINTAAIDTAAIDTAAIDTATKPAATFDSNLRQATDRLNDAFAQAITAGDADAAARAALDLDEAITGWSVDTLQSDDADYARSVLRSMITRLAGAATGGLRDPREVVGPFVQVLLDLRVQVRTDKRFDLSDMIRDRLAEVSVEVRDTPQGAEWGFRN
jgi:hypothetical protein